MPLILDEAIAEGQFGGAGVVGRVVLFGIVKLLVGILLVDSFVVSLRDKTDLSID